MRPSEEGYLQLARDILEAQRVLVEGIDAIDGLEIYGEPKVGVFTFGAQDFDIFAVADGLDEFGWVTNRCTEPPGIHILLTPNHINVVQKYLGELAAVVEKVKQEGISSRSSGVSY